MENHMVLIAAKLQTCTCCHLQAVWCNDNIFQSTGLWYYTLRQRIQRVLLPWQMYSSVLCSTRSVAYLHTQDSRHLQKNIRLDDAIECEVQYKYAKCHLVKNKSYLIIIIMHYYNYCLYFNRNNNNII